MAPHFKGAVVAPAPLDSAQQLIASLLDAGEPLAHVELQIDRAYAFDEEERAALWLLAWSHDAAGSHHGEREIAAVAE